MNCSETSEEDLDYMLHDAFVAEGDTSITDYLEQYDIDLRKSMVVRIKSWLVSAFSCAKEYRFRSLKYLIPDFINVSEYYQCRSVWSCCGRKCL